jgi:hypothetical protein
MGMMTHAVLRFSGEHGSRSVWLDFLTTVTLAIRTGTEFQLAASVFDTLCLSRLGCATPCPVGPVIPDFRFRQSLPVCLAAPLPEGLTSTLI